MHFTREISDTKSKKEWLSFSPCHANYGPYYVGIKILLKPIPGPFIAVP